MQTLKAQYKTQEPAAQNPEGEQGTVRVQVRSERAWRARWRGAVLRQFVKGMNTG